MPKIGQTPKAKPSLQPLWQTADHKTVRLYHGDVIAVLKRLPAKSVHCVVTSPPYWGLRDYGTGEWVGGDETCDHLRPVSYGKTSILRGAANGSIRTIAKTAGVEQWGGECGKCGAKRIDDQIGSEKHPSEFVAKMVEVFAEVRRVLRDDGTVWLNLGDTYVNGDQQLVPHKVAIALQEDGWIVRQDIVWSKPSPMPESVKTRCTKSHEYIFLLTKSMKYFYDAEAIKEAQTIEPRVRNRQQNFAKQGQVGNHTQGAAVIVDSGSKNKRSVWTVSSQGYDGAHYAVFPPNLIEPCIKAGTSEHGCCAECGAPWQRIVEEIKGETVPSLGPSKEEGNTRKGGATYTPVLETKTLGWEPTCECNGTFEKRKGTRLGVGSYHDHAGDGVEYGMRQKGKGPKRIPGEKTVELPTTVVEYVSEIPLDEHPVVPCVVLDPFMGSGTTAHVCIDLGRHAVGIDLSEKYILNNQVPRIVGALLSRRMTHLTGIKTEKVEEGIELELE